MVKTLLGGLSLLNEFNKRGVGETGDENFVGGDEDEALYAPKLGFTFEPGITESDAKVLLKGNKGSRPCRKDSCKPEHSNNFAGSAGYKQNQKKINNQVGVEASRRLVLLKVKQNRIENDCVNRLNKNTATCGGCNSNTSSDFKSHTRRNGTYERYYLKRGRTMLTNEERTECGNIKCNCA